MTEPPPLSPTTVHAARVLLLVALTLVVWGSLIVLAVRCFGRVRVDAPARAPVVAMDTAPCLREDTRRGRCVARITPRTLSLNPLHSDTWP